MSTTTTQYNDWGAKLLEWTSSEAGEIGNKNLSAFCNATDSTSLSQEDRLKAITSTPEVLALAVVDEKKVIILHSIRNLGGTLIRPHDKVIALLGTSHDAKAVELVVGSALKDYKSKAPKFDDIKDKATREELEGVPTLTRVSSACAHLSGIVIPPPFQAKIILETAKDSESLELDPIMLAERALVAARAFDAEHEGDDGFTEEALEKSEQLVRWLLSVHHGFVENTEFEENAEDQEIQAYRVQQHEQWIIPPLGDPRRVERMEQEMARLQSQGAQVNATLCRMNEVLEVNNKLASKKIELTEEKIMKDSDRTSKYHSSVISLLTNLASYDGETEAEGPSESILAILNCDSHGKAEKELVNRLREKGHEPSFAVGTSKAMHEGKFTWPSDDNPVNLSPFTISEASADDTSMNTRDIYISTTELNGEKMSEKQVEKWLKQAIKTPSTYYELVDQMGVFLSTLEILGGDESYVAHKVKQFIKVCKSLKRKIEAQIARDKDTAPYLLFQLGLRVNNYLCACERSEDLEDVPKSALSMSSIEDKIRNLELVPTLPKSFKSSSKRERDESEDEDEPSEKKKKKQKKKGKGSEKHGGAKIVRNDDAFEDLTLKDGEDWANYSGREARKDLPTWGSGDCKCKMCPKWNIKKFCFDDCNDAASHVPKSECPAEKKKEMKAWKDSKTKSA